MYSSSDDEEFGTDNEDNENDSNDDDDEMYQEAQMHHSSLSTEFTSLETSTSVQNEPLTGAHWDRIYA